MSPRKSRAEAATKGLRAFLTCFRAKGPPARREKCATLPLKELVRDD